MRIAMPATIFLGALLGIYSAYNRTDAAAPKSPLGLNLSGVACWSTEFPFADAFRQSMPWVSQQKGKGWALGGPLALDSHGNVRSLEPGQFAETLLFPDTNGKYPGGRYLARWDGDGELEFSGTAKRVAPEGRFDTRRAVVEVAPGDGPISIRVTKTDPENPLRNIRFRFPDTGEATFHPKFLANCAGFEAIRFMDWGSTNNSKIRDWKDRPTPDDAAQSRNGVAIELQIELANALKADAWFCVPHLATDDYVARMVALIRDTLDADRRAYIEYSNETWNGIFEQARYCQERGKSLGLSADAYEAQLRYSSQRSVEIFAIASKVLPAKRLVRVLAAHGANPRTGSTALDWQKAYESADAIAIAPYFGNDYGSPKRIGDVVKMKTPDLLEGCRASIRANREFLTAYGELAKKRKLSLLAYESGQHLAGFGGAENDESLTKSLQAANRDPGMKDLYLEDFKSWQDAGGGLNCVFSSVGRYSKWGSWGLKEYQDQPGDTAPKYRAVREWLTR